MKLNSYLLGGLLVLSLTACSGSTSDSTPTTNPDKLETVTQPAPTEPTPAPAPVPVVQEKIYGVTLDSIANLSDILVSLGNLKHKPTARIVFDENVSASYYVNAVQKISNVSFVMGEILDSFYVKSLSTESYKARTTEYLNALQDYVDIWEVGNEINGEWLGDSATVVAKASSAYDLVKARGKKAALTLYYNQDCWEKSSHEMFSWTQNNIPTRMRQGLDYVFISFYEDDCNGIRPDWATVFSRLATMFPNSKIGFGEVGTNITSQKKEFISRYYSMQINQPNYVGGYFWWYFKQDMVPSSKELWSWLNQNL